MRSNNSAKNPDYYQLTEDNIGDIMGFYGFKQQPNPNLRHDDIIANSAINNALEAERAAEAKERKRMESESSGVKGGRRSRRRKTVRRTVKRKRRTTRKRRNKK